LPAVDLKGEIVREIGRPGQVEVVVSTHGVGRGNRGELREDLRATDISGVDDEVTALQAGEGFRAEETVGIGDDGGFHGRRLAGRG
jgi:hypothetical protein